MWPHRTQRRSECAHCKGKLGLVIHRHYTLRLCSLRCKMAYLTKLAAERERLRRWLNYLRPS